MGPPDLWLRFAPLGVGVGHDGTERWARRCWLCVEVIGNLFGVGKDNRVNTGRVLSQKAARMAETIFSTCHTDNFHLSTAKIELKLELNSTMLGYQASRLMG